MKNLPLLLGTIIGSIALIFGVGFLFSRTSPTTAGPVDQALLETDLAHTKGATESATVTIVEFSDFQCPACRAAEPLVAQLAQEFGDRVRFAYRHFPLESIHPNARPAALAAEAAARQDRFWPFHDLLFDKQDEWSGVNNQNELRDLFVGYAESLELSTDQFRSDLDSPEVAAAVNADVALATQANVNATPTFFVNGTPTTTAQLRSSIETLLASQ